MRMVFSDFLSAAAVLWCSLAASLSGQTEAERGSARIPLSARAEQLIEGLPACSTIRTELENHTQGSGVDEPYMEEMQRHGIQRVLIEVRARVRNRRPDELRIERRLFFSKLDGPGSQITDTGKLKTIDESGLQRLLDQVARARVLKAPIVIGPDLHLRPPKEVTAFVEFFADSAVPRKQVVLGPAGHPAPLTVPVLNGDTVTARQLLESGGFPPAELNAALFSAALSKYDNTTMIRILLTAGADVNARLSDGSTPLMNAVAHPCNVIALLNAGADPKARDRWGRTALQIAQTQNLAKAVQLLE